MIVNHNVKYLKMLMIWYMWLKVKEEIKNADHR